MLDLVNRRHMNPDGENRQKPWKWIFIDSLIIALIAMFAVMPEAIPDVNSVYVMFKAFLISFVFQLAVERGLKRK